MIRHPVAGLESFAQALLGGAGMEADKAAIVARMMVLTDAMDRRTHGLAMLPLYLADIAKGGMRVSGSLQLLGRQEYGHKGFGLALMVEALSQGLSGHGRKDAPKRWGGNVFLQLIDPRLFAGADAFAEQMGELSERCRNNRPIDANRPVRVPGDNAACGIEQAQTDGIAFDTTTWATLADCAARLGVALP